MLTLMKYYDHLNSFSLSHKSPDLSPFGD